MDSCRSRLHSVWRPRGVTPFSAAQPAKPCALRGLPCGLRGLLAKQAEHEEHQEDKDYEKDDNPSDENGDFHSIRSLLFSLFTSLVSSLLPSHAKPDQNVRSNEKTVTPVRLA